MNTNKKWSISLLVIVVILLLGLGITTIFVDPYFHYHKPLAFLEYPLDNQRYQNNGIIKNFSYDAIITGTSMTENFKKSEFDAIFEVDSIKIPFSGASYKEVNNNLKVAVDANPSIRVILRGLDYMMLLDSKDTMNYDSYPEYLYDDYFYNDVQYIFNKSTFLNSTLKVFSFTVQGKKTPSFDAYSRWAETVAYGKAELDKVYAREIKSSNMFEMTEEDYKNVNENITQNVIELAKDNPQIDFYLFLTPYSIYYFDRINQRGELVRQLQAEKQAIELMVEYDNIHLYSFFDEFDMVCDLENYTDVIHYRGEINSQILLWMAEGEHRITKENYEEYCANVYEFYTTYNYDNLFSLSK